MSQGVVISHLPSPLSHHTGSCRPMLLNPWHVPNTLICAKVCSDRRVQGRGISDRLNLREVGSQVMKATQDLTRDLVMALLSTEAFPSVWFVAVAAPSR